MKKLSYWALMNPWKSQTLLVLCHLSLAVLAIYTGVWLFAHDVLVPKAFFYAGEILFFALLIAYPIRRARHKFWKMSFVKQKLMDAGFVLSYLLMAISVSNSDAFSAWNDTAVAPYVMPIVLKENVKPTSLNESKSPIWSKKELRRQFKGFVSGMKEQTSNAGNDNGKIGG